MKRIRLMQPSCALLLLSMSLLGLTRPALAQAVVPGFEQRTTPGATPTIPTPKFLPRPHADLQLPPAPPPRGQGLASGKSLFVATIVIEGNTVLPQRQLTLLASRYEGRQVTLEELFKLKDELTTAYLDAGYVNSGATLPD